MLKLVNGKMEIVATPVKIGDLWQGFRLEVNDEMLRVQAALLHRTKAEKIADREKIAAKLAAQVTPKSNS